jgi:hypothetical protein
VGLDLGLGLRWSQPGVAVLDDLGLGLGFCAANLSLGWWSRASLVLLIGLLTDLVGVLPYFIFAWVVSYTHTASNLGFDVACGVWWWGCIGFVVVFVGFVVVDSWFTVVVVVVAVGEKDLGYGCWGYTGNCCW